MEESLSNIVDGKSARANRWLEFWERAKRKEAALQTGRDRSLRMGMKEGAGM